MTDVQSGVTAKRIHPDAYGALTEALTLITWNKDAYKRDVRRRLRDYPELLARLDFSTTKRETSNQLVDMLMAEEKRYRELTVEMMTDISRLDAFPNLSIQKDAEERLAAAREAVANLTKWVGRHAEIAEEREKFSAELAAHRDQTAKSRSFAEVLDELRQEFLSLHTAADRQRAGMEFEAFLYRLFALFDLQPTLAYDLKGEQIDGSIYHDTNHYIVEAKWWAGTVEAKHLRDFDGKVRFKGKNALGLFVSVNGFSEGAKYQFRQSTTFITMDGQDLFCVLDGRIRLDEIVARKLEHANRTGDCYFPATQMHL